MGNTTTYTEQYSIFDYLLPELVDGFDELDFSMPTNTLSDKPKKLSIAGPVVNVDDYLHRAERLETLAKEEFSKLLDSFEISEVEKTLYSLEISEAQTADQWAKLISKRVIRPLIKSLTFDKDDEAMATLKSLVHQDFELTRVPEEDYGLIPNVRYLNYKSKIKGPILKMILREEGYSPLIFYGYQNESNTGSKTQRMFVDGTTIGDVALCLSYLLMFSIYEDVMNDAEMRARVAEGVGADIYINNLSVENVVCWESGLRDYGKDFVSIPLRDRMQNIRTAAPIGIPEETYEMPTSNEIAWFREKYCVSMGEIPFTRDVRRVQSSTFAAMGHPKAYVVTNKVCATMFVKNIEEGWQAGCGRLVYNRFLSHNNRKLGKVSHAFPMIQWLPIPESTVLFHALTEKMQKMKGKLRTLRYYESLVKEHKTSARVYQTKKNIPQKVISEMENSVFNDYFGYVEIDEACDLDKVRSIADEFVAFKDTYLPGFDSSDVQIRFRKLGRHKALGLYFPMLRCLCVDITSPSSFVHEFGHCVDHTFLHGTQNISDTKEFSDIYRKYCTLLEKAVREDKLDLKGKYDLSYYETPTEVFARCFEVYFARCKNLSMSICQLGEEMGFAYPKDDALTKLVGEYFDKLIGRINDNVKNVTAVKAA